MHEHEEVNVTQTLMDIKADIARISTKIDGLKEVSEKAEKALEMAGENQRSIDRIGKIQNWIIATVIAGIGVPIIVAIVKALIM